MSRAKRSTTAANASFISIRSMSSIVRPAFASALRLAGAGPVSMIVGSVPVTAVARIRARGFRPSSSPIFSLPTATRLAPSTMPEELPGRVDVVDLLDPVVLLQRHRVEAAEVAHHRERRLQLAERVDGRLGADELVVVEHDVVIDVEHRHHRVLEAALGLGGGGALLRARGVGVDVLAA